MPKPTDPNKAAARVVRDLTKEESLPPDVEAAWDAWSRSIQGLDERVRTLLRAAFEAGAEAAA